MVEARLTVKPVVAPAIPGRGRKRLGLCFPALDPVKAGWTKLDGSALLRNAGGES